MAFSQSSQTSTPGSPVNGADAVSKTERSISLSDRMLNVATIGVLVLVAATVVRGWVTTAKNLPQGPDPIAVGTALAPLQMVSANQSTQEVALTGTPKLLYVFSTTCGICASQRVEMGRWLRTLQPDRVVSASRESPDVTHGYWLDSAAAKSLTTPLQLQAATANTIHAYYVPYLIVTDAKGVVRFSHVGSLAGVDTAKVRELVSAR